MTDCTGCPVQQGTHKPAEAVHGIAEPVEALRLSAWLQDGAFHRMTLGDAILAGRELRRQHARIVELEAERAALKAAPACGLLDALEAMVDVCDGRDFDGAPSDAHMEKARAAIAAYKAVPAVQAVEPFYQWWSNGGHKTVSAAADSRGWQGAAEAGYNAARAAGSTLAAPQSQDVQDAVLLDFLRDQCIDLRCFTTSDGEDVGWQTVQHHMVAPRERVVSYVGRDDPRRAIREAMARIERDPYCTGPLHLEDDAAIAASASATQ